MKTKYLLIVIMLLGTTIGMAQNVSNDTTQHKARSEKDYYWQETDNGIFFKKGFVGIWTERPESELHVEGQILTQALRIGDFEFPRRGGTRDQFLRADGVWAVPAGGGGSTGGGNYWQPGAGSNIYYNAGNVAIGGTTANATFQVTGNMNIGNNPTGTTGINAFVGGKNSIASGNNSFAFGENVKATMSWAFAGGRNTEANNIVAIALGYEVRANATGSVAIGNFVETGGGTSVVIGSGYQTNRLVNNIPSSLMIGFKSTVPTFFVGESSGMNATGKIGIGNVTDPQAKLHIRADEDEHASLKLEATGTGKQAMIHFTENHQISASADNAMHLHSEQGKGFVFHDGDIYLHDIHSGIIMKSPNGQCWRGRLSDNGTLSFEQTTCPEDMTSALQEQPLIPGQLKIYPNPTGDKLTIVSDLNEQNAEVLISTVEGSTISRLRIVSNHMEISLNHFVVGTYLLSLEINGQIIETKKIIKQ